MRKQRLSLTNREKLIAEIKNALQYPKTTLEIMKELKAGKRKRVPVEFIDDALNSIDDAVRILNRLAGWESKQTKTRR